jgi:predicted Zn-dependent protease
MNLSHTVQLTPCDDYRHAIAPSHALEWTDLKETTLCPACRAAVTPVVQVPSAPYF